ncbi:MAG: CoA-binding protein [Desulfobacterales bacterium]|nr:MAG: CoA-binding protein [Desulfobacterales bacterium]
MPAIANSPLYPIMHPERVAVIGASNNMLTMGTTILNNLLSLGFQGQVFPVHPKLNQVLGLKAYAHVGEIPVVPDLALVVVPTPIVPQVMRDCGAKGIRRTIIVSGGFREAGAEGRQREQELLAIAQQYGIRFIGPNCIGVVNPFHRFNTTMFHYNAAPNGFIGMASQSGSFITQMFSHLAKFGLGFSQGFSVGNQADIDLADCVEYLCACDRTKVIGLYIEGLTRADKFIRIAREVSKTKPIVAMYVGGTEAGRRAGESHSGALAGSDAIYEGVFRQCGILRASSIEELFDFCWALGTQPLMAGNRVAVFTNSGGPGAAAADAADRAGLKLPALSLPTRQKLRASVPHTGSLNNPIDLTFTRSFEDIMEHIPRILLEDEGLDGILMYFLIVVDNFKCLLGKADSSVFKTAAEYEEYILRLCRRLARLVQSYNKPLLGSSFLTRDEGFIRELEDLGVPILPSPERSARAMGALYRYSRMRQALIAGESKR